MFGAGGGTASYKEIEEVDVVLLWGSNAREAHPIYFHHLMKGLKNGAKMFAVDPRRTSSSKFADAWLGLDVGTDIAMANAVAREIIHAGLVNEAFIAHSTDGYETYKASVESYTLEYAQEITGVPASAIKEMAHAYATAEKAQILWTLGITEHHNAVDNVLSLCNLALLTGHVGKWGSGLVPLRGQNNVQGGGDMGALPNKFPGFQDITNAEHRAKFEAVYGAKLNPEDGIHLTLMFEAMGRGELTAAFVLGENPADSEADIDQARKLLSGLDCLVVQDIFMTRTAELADVVFPASVAWAESDGTVTSSERRVQRTRPAVTPPGQARHDIDIMHELGKRMGVELGATEPEALWDELRSLSQCTVVCPTNGSKPKAACSGRAPTSTIRVARSCTVGSGKSTWAAVARHRSRSSSTKARTKSSPLSSRCGSPQVAHSTRTTPVSSRTASSHRSATAKNSTSTQPTVLHSTSSMANGSASRRHAVPSR